MESVIFDDTCTFPSLLDVQKHHICKQLLDAQKHHICKLLLQAVAYMHNQEVIHQDIKLANILVSVGSLVTKLCDLGIAKLKGIGGTVTSKQVGATGKFINPGMPLYISPECIMNAQKTTMFSDMWSVGATVSELYTQLTYWHFSSNDFENCSDMLECLIRKVERQEKPNIIFEKFF